MTSTLPPGYISPASSIHSSYDTDNPENDIHNPSQYSSHENSTINKQPPLPTDSMQIPSGTYSYIQEGDSLLSQNISSLSNEGSLSYGVHDHPYDNPHHIRDADGNYFSSSHQQENPNHQQHNTDSEYAQQYLDEDQYHQQQQQQYTQHDQYSNNNTDYVYQNSSFPPLDPYYYPQQNHQMNDIDDDNIPVPPYARKIRWSDEQGYALVQIHYSDKLHYSTGGNNEEEQHPPLGCCIII